MKLLNSTLRNILIFAIFLILAGTLVLLVKGQTPTLSTAQANTPTFTLPSTDTLMPPPVVTVVPIPSITYAPGATTTPLSNADTPAPGPTYTPTPVEVTAAKVESPVVIALNDAPLLSTELLSKLKIKERENVWVQTWPTENEMVIGIGYYPHTTFWRISLNSGQAQPLTNYQAEPDFTAAVAELKQFDERVDYVSVSPDGRWGAWGQGENLLVKQLQTNIPPVNLLGKVKYETFWGGAGRLVWSYQDDKLAYVVKYSDYQIRISYVRDQQMTIIPLESSPPSDIAWSVDEQYLAFAMLEEPQSGITHVYVVRQDGTGLTPLTQHGLANGPIHWSPTGKAIVYTHDSGDGNRPWLVTLK